jgi:phospholipid/cholesterol/gamma-HCH transport system permease protein
MGQGASEFIDFIGQTTVAFGKMLRLRARFQLSELFVNIEECGARALPIVTLISFLLGLILAFMGAVQLQRFGASIYVADLVALAMTREMGAVMTAIIMSGRRRGLCCPTRYHEGDRRDRRAQDLWALPRRSSWSSRA